MAGGGMTSGDPLGGDEPPRGPDVEERRVPYGSGRVPPGAFVAREREELVDPYADAPAAEWWRRAVAAIIDSVVVGAAAAFIIGLALAPLNVDDTSGVIGAILLVSVALVAISFGALLYAPLVMARTNGRTFGKMATSCRVVRADGRRIDFGWAALREVVVKAIALGVAGAATGGIAYLVDFLWPFFDRDKRALHDLVVDSRVIRD